MADATPIPDADQRFLDGAKTPVVSSNVAWIQYEGTTLNIGYKNGGEYYCEDVDAKLALKIRKDKSVGHALHVLENTHGTFKRVEK